jgi:hypothetical protein
MKKTIRSTTKTRKHEEKEFKKILGALVAK